MPLFGEEAFIEHLHVSGPSLSTFSPTWPSQQPWQWQVEAQRGALSGSGHSKCTGSRTQPVSRQGGVADPVPFPLGSLPPSTPDATLLCTSCLEEELPW